MEASRVANSATDVELGTATQDPEGKKPDASTGHRTGSGASASAAPRTWKKYFESLLIPPETDGGETSTFVRDVTEEFDGYRPAAWEEVSEAAYRADLAAIRSGSDHFADLEACGFVTLPCTDLGGRPIILVAPQLLPDDGGAADMERLFRFVIQKLDAVAAAPFSVVYVHSGAEEWRTRPSMMAMRALYERLAIKFKLRMHCFYVLHTDMTLWAAMNCVAPFLSHGFWTKTRFMARVEFLWDHVKQASLEPKLPRCVKEHDGVLEEQPLHDFGYVKPSVDTIPDSMPV